MFEKLKLVQEVEAVINDFTSQFDCTAVMDTDFYVDVNKNLIHFSFCTSEKSDKEFMETVYRCNPRVTMDTFLWALLHEIFHVETYDDLTEEELDYCHDMKDLIAKEEIDPMEYYNLPIEKLATEGAVRWANSHVDELAAFWGKLQPVLMNFYKVNNFI